MTQLDVNEAGEKLAELVRRVLAGEDVFLAEAGRPVARIVPAGPNPRLASFGLLRGKLWLADDFDAPLPEDELREWEK